jgi:predicted transcriptional regulator
MNNYSVVMDIFFQCYNNGNCFEFKSFLHNYSLMIVYALQDNKMARVDELRLIARVARMYYEWNMRQSTIAQQLGLSQATVSRLLNRSKQEGIIRISVNIPQGVYTEMEEDLVKKFHLRDAIVVDCLEDNEKSVQRDIGASAAYYLESAIRPNDVIGISSWSATLLALVDALHHVPNKTGIKVVQILGGVGSPGSEVHASRLTSRLASLLNGEAVFLPAPGIVGSEAAMQVLLNDEYVETYPGALQPGDHCAGWDRSHRTLCTPGAERQYLLAARTAAAAPTGRGRRCSFTLFRRERPLD